MNRDFKTGLRSSDRASNKKALLQQTIRLMKFLNKTLERTMACFNRSAVKYAAL
jgi:hypothetical protein